MKKITLVVTGVVLVIVTTSILLTIWYLLLKRVPGIVATTKNGDVQGIISVSRDGREFYEWLGIPYAQPPIGDLRFASPRAAKTWSGVRDGGEYGPICSQVLPVALGRYRRLRGKDCLYLNVHAPKLAEKMLLPVMVWIHGGAFMMGSSNQYRPEYFMDQEVVLVTINYRLGPFGFLSTADEAIRGNMGLKDQVMALKWVRHNIETFGGDPKKVTIFGESAGGVSVHLQVISPKTPKGLFNKAIAQSGLAVAHWAVHLPHHAKKLTLKFAKSIGCDSKESSEILKCLKGKSFEDLLDGFAYDTVNFYKINPDRDGVPLRPCIETIDDSEAFLTQHPLDILESGQAQRIPLITGVTADEGLLGSTVLYKQPDRLKAFEANWTSNVLRQAAVPLTSENKDEIAQKLKDFYLPKYNELSEDERCQAYTKLFTDTSFNLPLDYLVRRQREYSPVYPYVFNRRGGPSLTYFLGELSDKLPVWLDIAYVAAKFSWNKVFGNKGRDYGVCHFDDIPMIFRMPGIFNLVKDDDDPDYLFSKKFVELWTDFAKDKKKLELNGIEFEPAPISGPVKYLHLSENSSVAIPEFAKRTEFLEGQGFLRPQLL